MKLRSSRVLNPWLAGNTLPATQLKLEMKAETERRSDFQNLWAL
jgi:hypothetical protein